MAKRRRRSVRVRDRAQAIGLISVRSTGGNCTQRIKCEREQEVVWIVVNRTGDKQKVKLVKFDNLSPGAPKNPFAPGKKPAPNPPPLGPWGVAEIHATIADGAFGDYSYDIELNGRRATHSPVLEI
jgi:hypothetical protein